MMKVLKPSEYQCPLVTRGYRFIAPVHITAVDESSPMGPLQQEVSNLRALGYDRPILRQIQALARGQKHRVSLKPARRSGSTTCLVCWSAKSGPLQSTNARYRQKVRLRRRLAALTGRMRWLEPCIR